MEDVNPKSTTPNYAPANRNSPAEIQSEFRLLSSDEYFQMFVGAMPDLALVVNQNRQVVFANEALLSLIGQEEIEQAIGMRPGEIFECENLKPGSNGCGTTKACIYCGIVNSVLEAQRSGKPGVHFSRISSEKFSGGQSIDLEIKASPLLLNDKKFIILSIKDISAKKRKQMLEKLFFHDILNTATGLKESILALEDQESSEKMRPILESAKKTCGELVDEILAQRILVSAETNELVTQITRCNSRKLLEDVSSYLEYNAIANEKRIYIDPFFHNFYFDTDPTILKRVLINLVKNALEACSSGEVIQLGCRMAGNFLRFLVNNPGVIAEDVQSQLFKHSFSTKGENRGLGTYSIKLLTTRYLSGDVSFESDFENGTTFYIDLPFSIPKV